MSKYLWRNPSPLDLQLFEIFYPKSHWEPAGASTEWPRSCLVWEHGRMDIQESLHGHKRFIILFPNQSFDFTWKFGFLYFYSQVDARVLSLRAGTQTEHNWSPRPFHSGPLLSHPVCTFKDPNVISKVSRQCLSLSLMFWDIEKVYFSIIDQKTWWVGLRDYLCLICFSKVNGFLSNLR